MARSKRKQHPIGANEVQIAAGIFVILLSVLFLLSGGSHLSFLGGYVFSYLFGVIGYFGFPLIFVVFGLGLLIPKLGRFTGIRFFFGTLFILISVCAIFSSAVFSSSYPNVEFASYLDAFSKAGSTYFGYATYAGLGGGTVGFVIARIFKEISMDWLLYIIAILILIGGLILALFPLWKLLYRDLQASLAIANAKKKQRAVEKEEFRQKMEHEKQTRIAMDSQDEAPAPKRSSNPLDSLIFEPAKRVSSIPSRASKYHPASEQSNLKSNLAEDDIVYPHASAPRSMPNPNADLYRSSSLMTAGLQEAFFDPNPEPKPSQTARPTANKETPIQTTPVSPAPTVPQHSGFEATTLEDLTPSFVPTASTKPNKPIVEEAPAPSIFESTPQEPAYEAPRKEAPRYEAPRQEEKEDVKYEQPSLFEDAPAEPFAPLPTLGDMQPNPRPAPIVEEKPVAEEAPVQEAPVESKEVSDIKEEDEEPLPPYQYPPLSLLSNPSNAQNMEQMERECAEKEAIINQTFADLGVGAKVAGHTIGPSVTRYAIQPDRNVSVSALARYVKDIEVRIGGVATRYAERVTGMTTPALETANNVVRMVTLKECIEALPPVSEKTRMIVPFGVKITGECVYANLCEFPHLLLAGTTGSGKSVFVHSMLLSLIMRNRPEELKLVLVDPKRVEMTKYKDIPHLLCPIVKEPVHAKNALKKLVEEMERRYMLFDNAAVQKIEEYNTDYAPIYHKKKLPYILVVIDEFYDLVNNCKEVSEYVLTLGAKARACGIHMIIATQRPDSKVISGTIKANLPTAVALSVRSSVDSQVILGAPGAEDLAGHGDMLIDCAQVAKKEFVRAQGCFVDNRELRAVPDFIRGQQKVKYHPAFLELDDKEEEEAPDPSYGGAAYDSPLPSPSAAAASDGEAKYQYIKSVIMTREFTSISQIQRDFSVGFPRAGKIFARLQKEGVVDLTPVSSSKGCRVLLHEAPSTSSAGSTSTSSTEPSWKSDPEEDIG